MNDIVTPTGEPVEPTPVVEPTPEPVVTPTTSEPSPPAGDPWTKTAYLDEKRKRQELESELEKLKATPAPSIDESQIDDLVDKRLAEKEQEREQAKIKESQQKTATDFLGKAEQAKSMFGDADPQEVATEVCQALYTSPDTQLEIMKSEKSWEIMKHLKDNPDALRDLANSSPIEQGRKLAAIENSLKSGPNVTSAPDPITPLSGGSGGVDDYSDLPQSQYESELRSRNGGSVFPK